MRTALSELHRYCHPQYTMPHDGLTGIRVTQVAPARPSVARVAKAAFRDVEPQADSASPTASKYRSRLAWIAARASATPCQPFILAVFPSNSL